MIVVEIRGLTLWQPWASLIAIGAKQWETRSWSTKYRGLVAIHASANPTGLMRNSEELFRHALSGVAALPLRAIVAIGVLTDVQRTDEFRIGNGYIRLGDVAYRPEEAEFGDFTVGRFAWRIDNVTPLPKPIPCKGTLGLWRLTPELREQVISSISSSGPR